MSKTEVIAVSVDEACNAISAGRTTFYSEVAAGNIKVKKIGRRTIVEMAELRRYIAALPTNVP